MADYNKVNKYNIKLNFDYHKKANNYYYNINNLL